LAVLTGFASLYGTAWHVVACSVYGATLVLLYAASTLYHSIYFPRAKRVLRELDHSAIYLLIAGTYTPFTLVNLRGPWGWSLFGVVWGLATIGILLRLSGKQRGSVLPLVLYVVMGWVGVIGLKPLFDLVGPVGLSLVVAGGLAYTAGIIFYVWERLPYNHAVWHVFVLAGSAFQFFAVLFYVIPLAGRS
jgi:hemolysin III